MSKSASGVSDTLESLKALVGPIKACATCQWWLGHCHTWDFADLYPCGHPEHNIVLDRRNTIRQVGAEDCCDKYTHWVGND